MFRDGKFVSTPIIFGSDMSYLIASTKMNIRVVLY